MTIKTEKRKSCKNNTNENICSVLFLKIINHNISIYFYFFNVLRLITSLLYFKIVSKNSQIKNVKVLKLGN